MARRLLALYAAYNARDWDAFFAYLDPACEWDPVEEGGVATGRAAITELAASWLSTWTEFRWEPEELEVAPAGDRAFAALLSWARSRGSDAVVEGRFYHVIELSQGRLRRVREYMDRAEARAEFGRAGGGASIDSR